MTNVSTASPALTAVMAEAAAAGLHLRVSAGGTLAIDGQPGPGLLARLKANKHALLAVLRATPSTAGTAT